MVIPASVDVNEHAKKCSAYTLYILSACIAVLYYIQPLNNYRLIALSPKTLPIKPTLIYTNYVLATRLELCGEVYIALTAKVMPKLLTRAIFVKPTCTHGLFSSSHSPFDGVFKCS